MKKAGTSSSRQRLFSLFLALALMLIASAPCAAPVAAVSPVTVSCWVSPANVEVGQVATLYVALEILNTTPGTNTYDINMAFPNDGRLTFNETTPRKGEPPWDSTLPINETNKIDNDKGKILATAVKQNGTSPFFGKAVLFSAPFTLNQKAPVSFTYTKVFIVRFDNFQYYAEVDAKTCGITGGVNHPLYLPSIYR